MPEGMKIRKDIKGFVQALHDEKLICGDSRGKWYYESFKMKMGRKLFNTLDCCRIAKVGHAFNICLDQLEKIPVRFNTSRQLSQKKEFSEFLQAAKVVRIILEEKKSHYKVKKQLDFLDQRIAGLKYRIEKCNGGFDKSDTINEEDIENLKIEARAWKGSEELYENKDLLPQEEAKLVKACEYPEFSKLLLSNPLLRLSFFKWVLRDNNPVDVFVQFPSTCKLLKTCLFSGRLGRFAQECLSIVRKNSSEGTKKVVTMPFEVQKDTGLETKNISILKSKKEVIFKGDYKVKIKDIFEDFKEKKDSPGKFEFFDGKISNFNSSEFGWWNPQKEDYDRIDLSKKDSEWWKDLPVFETLSEQKLKERYGIAEFITGNWVAIACSTRESASLNIRNSHAYLKMAIPNESGDYSIYPFGRFPAEFPNTLIKQVSFLADTTKAKASYPDENVFYSHRQHAYKPLMLSLEKGKALMEKVRSDLLQSREGQTVFQFCGENCAYWTQTLLEDLFKEDATDNKAVPNLFRCELLKAELRVWPINHFLKFVDELPEKIKNIRKKLPQAIRTFTKNLSKKLQLICLKIAEILLCSWRGVWVSENGQEVWKSVSTSLFRYNYKIFHSAYLHHQIMNNRFSGAVSMGNFFASQIVIPKTR